MKIELMKNILLVFFLVVTLVTAGFSYNGVTKVRRINEEITGVSGSFQPTHTCASRSEDDNQFYCFAVTTSLKTCYTLPDRKGGKRCLTEPFWQEIPDEPITSCPSPKDYCNELDDICPTELNNFCELLSEEYCPSPDCSTCPKEIQYVTKYVDTPCVQTCKGCGSGGGGSGSSCTVQQCVDTVCHKVSIVAYIDNEDGKTEKHFCNSTGYEAKCMQDQTLEMPFDLI